MVLVLIIILIVIVGGVILIYNGLVRSKQRVDEAFSDITVQMKRRFDLIPNLVNTVKGYAAHEKTVLEDVTKARTAAMSASESNPNELAKTDNALTGTLKSLFAVAENYPDLKANENFKQLQEELVDAEDKIMAARRFYNNSVKNFNTKLKVFPTNIFAGMLHFAPATFFDVAEGERADVEKPVDVKF